MKILYDYQIFSWQKYGGISRYFFELIKHLPDEISFKLPILLSTNHYIANKEISRQILISKNYHFPEQDKILKIINKLYSIQFLKFSKYDIFHPTYYSTYFLRHIGNKPFVITCYDLIQEKFSKKYPELDDNGKTILTRGILFKKASKIIAISESTKRDMVEIYKIPEQKIEVIYLASSMSHQKRERLINENYLLFVGSRNLYKNFTLFLESIADLLLENPGLLLICAGGGGFNIEETAMIDRRKLTNQVRQIAVHDEDIENLYTHAMMFIFPSLYEGFGIPVLESFSCGCPVLLSNTSSLPEVGGDAALYFDPTNKDSIKETVSKALGSQELRSQMREKGYQQLTRFSWEKTAAQTVRIYKSVG